MADTTSEEKAVDRPSGMKGVAQGIRTLVAEKAASPEEKKEVGPESEKKPCETCDEKKGAPGEEKPKLRFFIVDKETGQETPAAFKSEGKEYVPDSVDKIKTWIGLGIHGNRRLEDLKKHEEVVKTVLEAVKDGRIVIKDKNESPPSEKEKVEEKPSEDEEDLITDPVILKEREKRKTLETEVKDLKKTIDTLKQFVVVTKTDEMRKQIESEIENFSNQYPLGKRRVKEVWKLLAEVGDDGPTHTVETAMKAVHEQSLGDFKDWIKEHPEFIEKDKIKEEGIKEYLKDKDKKEEAPVSSPSGIPAVTSAAPKEVKGMKDAVAQMKVFLGQSVKAGKEK